MNFAITSFVILLWCVFLYFVGRELIKYFRSKKKFENNKAEYISDLYKLQMKWTRKGEHDYASGITLVIQSFNLPPLEEEAKTEYGKSVAKKLHEQKQQ